LAKVPLDRNPKIGSLYIYLMGGLGNQLFQVAAGISLSHLRKQNLLIDETFGNYRKNYKNQADIRTFENANLIAEPLVHKNLKILSRMLGLLIRLSLSGDKSSRKKIIERGLKFSLSIILSLSESKLIRIWSASNIGFESIPKSSKSQYLVGYFQTYRFASDPYVYEKLKTLKIESSAIEQLSLEAESEKPLILHVRLGDYIQETTFGTLGSDYYRRALTLVFDPKKYLKIWVFSDEIEKAKQLIPKDFDEFVRWFPKTNETSAETLEKMRLGHAYIIGNSTFSWWAAFLSKTPNAPTIAPSPWFQGMDEPNDLIPPQWRRLAREEN